MLKLTALTNLSNYLAVLWRSHKVFKILVSVLAVSVVAGGTFVSLREYEKRKIKVFAATSAYQVELPKGINKDDLSNLSTGQKEQLDKQIGNVLSTKIQKAKLPEESRQVVVVVLTQNNQPILPDLEKNEEPSPIQPPAGRSEPTATLTPIPLPPCTDSDGGKDYFTKGTVTTSYGDKKTDFCSDPNIVGEYSCVPGAIFAFDGFICPGSCSYGACLQVSSTPTPSRTISPTAVLSPTITPTPTNVPCVDTDGGKDIYTKGTVTTWGKSYEDTCYSLQGGPSLTQCSDYFCRLLEMSCQPQGYQGEGFTCQYGCKNGACVKEAPAPTVTPTKIPTPPPGIPCEDSDGENYFTRGYVVPAPGQGDAVIDSCQPSHPYVLEEAICDTDAKKAKIVNFTCPAGCLEGACRKSGDLTFSYQGDIEEKYQQKNGRKLSEDVYKVYSAAKEIYGPAFAEITIKVRIGEYSYYNVSTNEMVIGEQYLDFPSHLVFLIIEAMHDDLANFMPFNWEIGMRETAEKEVYIRVFEPGKDSLLRFYHTFYELSGSSPAWATNNGNLSEIDYSQNPGPSAMNAVAFHKIYLEDKEFFVRFNKALYQQTIDGNLKDKLVEVAKSVKPVVEGQLFDDWFAGQYILHLKNIPGNYLMPFVYKDGSMKFTAQLTEVKESGDRGAPNGKTVTIKAYNADNVLLWTKSVNSQNWGIADFGDLPQAGTPGFAQNYTGAVKFEITAPGFNPTTFCYPYQNGQPLTPNGSLGLFGCVLNRTSGVITLKTSSSKQIDLQGGMFSFSESAPYKGSSELTYYEVQPGDSSGFEKTINKDVGDYYSSYRMLAAASSQTRGSPRAPTPNCTDGWQDYENEDFKLKFEIPSGWTDNSVDEHQSETFIYRHLISTTTPEQQLDPKYKISYFEILASTSDLKNSDYGTWLENNTGNQQKTPVDFKGIPAEKYTDDTQMPCASQTEEETACNYHSEIYYFEKDDIYYLLSLGIYTSPDVKEQNETNLKCFLENFELSGQEETVGGMKLFTSQRLQFKIRYPAELFAHEWQSDYKPNINAEKPDSDRNIVQFFKNKDLKGEKITIRRDTNSQRKTAKDFAKAYWSASEESLKHWKPKNIDFVVYSVKVQGSNEEEKTYLTPLGDWMYIFDSSETGGLQSALEKMLPTLEFFGSGAESISDLIPCPDELFSTSEQLIAQQENWWEKPDPCDSRPEQKVCGYTRSIFDNGVIQVSNSDYRNSYCYCSFFEKSGSRTYRGTEMFSLGYKEGACK